MLELAQPSLPASLVHDFTVTELIGHGGNATVYKGLDSENRTVAIKMYDQRMERDVAFVAYFRRDVQQARGLNHLHVLPPLSYGYADEHYYITSEFIDGGNLESYLVASEDLLSPETGRILRQVCEGLQYIHRTGRLHSNIKPTNILLRGSGAAVLADIGPSHQASTTGLTMTDAALGSVAYFSPEKVLGGTLSPASDIYSLGIVLYQLATGALPFAGSNLLALANKLVHDEPPPPRKVNPYISPALEAIILRAIAKNPEERYASAQEFGDALAVEDAWGRIVETSEGLTVRQRWQEWSQRFVQRYLNW
jgi:serine/threonine-protein kinase